MVVADLEGPEDTSTLASECIKSKKSESIRNKASGKGSKGAQEYRASSTVNQLK